MALKDMVKNVGSNPCVVIPVDCVNSFSDNVLTIRSVDTYVDFAETMVELMKTRDVRIAMHVVDHVGLIDFTGSTFICDMNYVDADGVPTGIFVQLVNDATAIGSCGITDQDHILLAIPFSLE